MVTQTKIEWTESTWNPVRGCSRVSEGCRYCYAERIAARFAQKGSAYEGIAKMTSAGPRWMNRVQRVPDVLNQPLKWKKPRLIFVNSMSDLFHEDVPLKYIQEVFDVMRRAGRHQFQVLTKRAERLAELSPKLRWLPNVWMGVSVESAEYTFRIDCLRGTEAQLKFLSLEPLIGRLGQLRLDGIHWVIVGGESGPGARPMNEGWVAEIRDQCREDSIPLFVKQMGTVWARNQSLNAVKVRSRGRKGDNMSDWREDLRIRDYPKWS